MLTHHIKQSEAADKINKSAEKIMFPALFVAACSNVFFWIYRIVGNWVQQQYVDYHCPNHSQECEKFYADSAKDYSYPAAIAAATAAIACTAYAACKTYSWVERVTNNDKQKHHQDKTRV